MSAKKATQCVHAGSDQAAQAVPGVTTPIYTSTSFRYPNEAGEVYYPRYYNIPTQQVAASKIAQLENGEAGLVLSSGMAAVVSTLFGLLRAGDHAVFHSGIYGGSRSFVDERFSRCAIEHALVYGTDVADFEAAIRDNTKVLFFESPTNPLLQVVDIAKVAEMARSRGVLTVMDNTFASPILQNPLDLGVDVVIHSGTKYLNGHSDVNCGAIVTSNELMQPIMDCAVSLGGTLDVRACYLLERGLKTLALRVERQSANAARFAAAMVANPRVRTIFYPGLSDHPGHEIAARQMSDFGGMVSLDLDADEATTVAMMSRLKLAQVAVSLGGVETLACRPKETSHAKISAEQRQREGITDSLMRVSIGIEDVDDVIADFEQALS